MTVPNVLMHVDYRSNLWRHRHREERSPRLKSTPEQDIMHLSQTFSELRELVRTGARSC